MLLYLEQDQSTRPLSLTQNHISVLLSTQSKKKGFFQLLSFKKKKDLVFSTKISDGFFQVKVMMVQEAAKQLEGGEVKQFSILEGWIRNHGDGMLIVREKMIYWSYDKTVGHPLSWRMKKENINHQGSNTILWNSQTVKNMHSQSFLIQTSKKKEGNSQQIPSKNPGQFNNSSAKLPEHNSVNTLATVTQTQSLNCLRVENLIAPLQKIQNADFTQPQELKTSEKKQKIVSKNNQLIYSLLFQSEDEEVEKNPVANEESETLQMDPSQSIVPSIVNQKIDLRFIFNALEEVTPSKHQQWSNKKENNQNQAEETDDQEVFLQWLNLKKENKKVPKLSSPLRKSLDQKKHELYHHLMSSSDSQSEQDKQENQSIKNLNPLLSNLSRIYLGDVFHGVFQKSSTNWWSTASLRCLAEPTSKDYSNAIIEDQSNQYLIEVVFLNLGSLSEPLYEGAFYTLGKGFIRASKDNDSSGSQCEIEFDCSRCIIYKNELDEQRKNRLESSEHYTPISQILKKEEGEKVHLFGVIKSARSIKSKYGLLLNYEIVDVINEYSITLTQYDTKLNLDSLSDLVNSAITVYSCFIKAYKGKKNVVVKAKSIIKYNWLPFTSEAFKVRKWLENNNNRVEMIDLNQVNFTECNNLVEAETCSASQIYIKNVTIIQINSKYSYIACAKCFKKVQEGRCRACGQRKNDQIVQRIFLRGVIGDDSSQMEVIWSNSYAQLLLNDGFEQFKSEWFLDKVSVWIQRGKDDILSIVKMKKTNAKQRIANLFTFIESRTLP